MTSSMTSPNAVPKELSTESEAASALGISMARLHELLDQHIFNEGSKRPPGLQFNAGDLLLLAYWNKEASSPVRDKVVAIRVRR